jgi:hypothetical protein
MNMETKRYRVKNVCKFDIGVLLPTGQRVHFGAGKWQFMTVDEIMYAESICTEDKYFAKQMLVPIDTYGNKVPIEEIECYITTDDSPFLTDEEIAEKLKKSATVIKAWLTNITDEAQLDAIYRVAITMDLSSAKIKVLSEKMPEKDFINSDTGE